MYVFIVVREPLHARDYHYTRTIITQDLLVNGMMTLSKFCSILLFTVRTKLTYLITAILTKREIKLLHHKYASTFK